MAKKHIGSSFDDFLHEETMLEEATAVAIKRVISWQIAEEMKNQQLTKTALAKRMHTFGCHVKKRIVLPPINQRHAFGRFPTHAPAPSPNGSGRGSRLCLV